MKSAALPYSALIALLCFVAPAHALAPDKLSVADLARLETLSDPQISPDGEWIAYTVEQVAAKRDEMTRSIWMVSWDSKQTLRLTGETTSASSPQWSPDGQHLAFLRSGTGSADGDDQIWLLNRRGGEAQKLTDIRGEISSFSWAPDAKRLAIVLQEPEDWERTEKDTAAPRPVVINRYQFKSDEAGYHSSIQQPRIFLYDIATRALTALTSESGFAESLPSWSPDGSRIAFVSNRDADWDRTQNNDIWVAQARAGATLQKLSAFQGGDEGPLTWSKDNRHIAYLQGSEPKYWLYNWLQLAVVPSTGGSVSLPATTLDRDMSAPQFSADGRYVYFLVSDDRRRYLARVPVGGGAVQHLTQGDRVVSAFVRAEQKSERVVVLAATAHSLPALYALEGTRLRQLTQHNSWTQTLRLGVTRDIEFPGHDGMSVHGLLTQPADWVAGKKYPTLLWIHGGPYYQDEYTFDFEQQLFAAQGYAVLQINYRGSAGRGTQFGRGIFADWGNADVKDLLAGINHLIALGIADPERLGVGGWSQGGILTDFVIAHDPRFKAAISGAGVANQLGVYGHDQYTYMYDLEFGQPWANRDLWIKLSYPFFNADKIRTPTLFVGGDQDFNVPILGSEQMYQALQSLKVPTQLVIYPGEHHSIERPSFNRDRLERYLAWFARYIEK